MIPTESFTNGTASSSSGERLDVVVIGAGQAGLAMGYFLARQGRRFVILERANSVGSAWRERWESLTLFTPRRYSALPGLLFPGEPDGYPTRDEVIAYLERYAESFELPIVLNGEVKKVEQSDDGRFRLEVDGRIAHRRPDRRRDWALPDAVRAEARHEARRRCLSDARRRLPQAGRRADRDGARGRWRQHRLPDREGAVGDAQGRPFGRFPPEAAAPTRARARPLLVAHEGANPRQDGRLASRPQAEHTRHTDRVESTRAQEALRSRAQAAPRRRRWPHGSLRRRQRARSRRRHLGDAATAPTTPGSSCRSSTRTGACATAAASPMSPASTSSGSPGSTRAARR